MRPWNGNEPQPFAPNDDIVAPEFVANVSGTREVVWADPKGALWKGLRLAADDRVELQSGLIEITFRDGATTLVEGPACFRVISRNSGELLSGKLTAQIPKRAVGFTLETEAARVVDLGTELGVRVDQQKTTLIHVYEGKVEVVAKNDNRAVSQSRKRVLKAGQSLKVNVSGTLDEVDALEAEFVRTKDFNQDSGFQAWLEYSRQLRADANVVAYYTFEKKRGVNDRLVNQAVATRGRFDGVLDDRNGHSPTWTTGRWNNKRALSFQAARGQRVRIRDWKSTRIDRAMTLAAWIRLRSNSGYGMIASRWKNDGHAVYYLALRGQANQSEGRGVPLSLRIAEADSGAGLRKSETVDGTLTNTSDGWVHVAFTLEARGPVRLYKNGKEVDSALKTYAHDKLRAVESPLVLGGFDGFFFDGRMDELLVMRRAMSPQEIRNMYDVGNPNPNVVSTKK